MNLKYFLALLGLALAGGAGCASDRLKPSGVIPSTPTVPPPAISLTDLQLIEHAAAQPPGDAPGEGWRSLFDGRSLAGWRVTDFGGQGRVELRNGLIVLPKGGPFTGVNYTNETPKVNYEVAFEAMRVSGSDFFCGFTCPVKDSHASLIVGGWGGSLVGISCLDGADASENETTHYVTFETGKWYRIRVRVTENKLEAWIEQKKVANVTTTGRKVSLRFGDIELSKPFGIASWDTGGAIREVKLRAITAPDSPAEQ